MVGCTTTKDSEQKEQVVSGLSTYDDSTGQFSLRFPVMDTIRKKFIPYPNSIVSYRISNIPHWISFELSLERDQPKILECFSGMLDIMQVAVVDQNGNKIQMDSLKWNTPAIKRKIRSWRNVFPIQVPKDGRYTIFVKVFKNNGSLQLPIVVWNPDEFYKSQYSRALYFGLAFGIFGIIIVLAFSMFVAVREIKFLYYGLYILGAFYCHSQSCSVGCQFY